jgi:16S rRNA (guanine527-N7)-methyltransferase
MIGTKNKCYFEKDIDALYTKHILHSLVIAKIDFVPGTYVLDVELVVDSWNSISDSFPETRFHLIDIAKKIKVVQAVVDGLGLENVRQSNYEQN